MLTTVFLDLPPLQSAGGTLTLPGSKSISNRVLLLAALCSGRTTLHDVLDSDDTRVMLDALHALGCAKAPCGQSRYFGKRQSFAFCSDISQGGCERLVSGTQRFRLRNINSAAPGRGRR